MSVRHWLALVAAMALGHRLGMAWTLHAEFQKAQRAKALKKNG